MIRDAQHVERVARAADGTLTVYSERGIGSFELAPGVPLPPKICFSYRAGREFDSLEGFEPALVDDDGAERPLAFVVEDGCVQITGPRKAGRYRIRFVDRYR